MGAITILIYLLLVVIVIIDWRKTVIIVDMRQKLDRAQAEIRALVLPGSIDHDAQKRRGKK